MTQNEATDAAKAWSRMQKWMMSSSGKSYEELTQGEWAKDCMCIHDALSAAPPVAAMPKGEEPSKDIVYIGAGSSRHFYIGKDRQGFYVFETPDWKDQPYSGYKENWKDELQGITCPAALVQAEKE